MYINKNAAAMEAQISIQNLTDNVEYHLMIFDTGANISITGEESLFVFPLLPFELPVTGINTNPVYAKGIGMTVAGPMMLVPGLQNTLVSYSFVRKLPGHDVKYDETSESFAITTPEHKIEFTLDDGKGLLTAKVPKALTENLRQKVDNIEGMRECLEEEMRGLVHGEVNMADRLVAVQALLEEDSSLGEEPGSHLVSTRMDLTKCEILTKIHRALNHPSDEAMKRMIAKGTIEAAIPDLNSEHSSDIDSSPRQADQLRPSDVDLWRKLYGHCAPCEVGKGSLSHRKVVGRYATETNYAVGELWHGDIVFQKTMRGSVQTFLICSEHQTGYLLCTLMGGRASHDVTNAIKRLSELCQWYKIDI